MPATSKAQFKAMHAAAEGKSTIGIPKKVGAEFVKGQSPKGLPRYVMHKKVEGGLKKAFPK